MYTQQTPETNPEKSVWEKGDCAALHYLKLTLRSTDHQYIRGAETAKTAWKQLAAHFETAGVQNSKEFALHRSLWRATWNDDGVPLRDHLAKMRSWRDELRDDGIDFSDKHYVYALFGILVFASLPEWGLFKQAWLEKYTREEAAIIEPAIAEKAINIQDEDLRRHAEEPTRAHKGTFPQKMEIRCGNCKKTGHSATQCYSKGVGAGGQDSHRIRPRTFGTRT